MKWFKMLQCCTPLLTHYQGWTAGLQKGGYATNKQYAASLNAIIKQYHLDQYDQQVMTEMKKDARTFGCNQRDCSGNSVTDSTGTCYSRQITLTEHYQM